MEWSEKTSETVRPDQMITLNVGGQLHTTSLATLSNYPNSMLGSMFSGRHEITAMTDKDGNPFIDRNGKTFAHVLDFMRNRQLPAGFNKLDLLRLEADFFQIPELVAIVDERLEEIKKKEEKERLWEQNSKIFQYHLELIDIESNEMEEWRKMRPRPAGPFEDQYLLENIYDVDYNEDELSPYEIEKFKGLILKGPTAVIQTMSPSDLIRDEINTELEHVLQLSNAGTEPLPKHVAINLVRKFTTKMQIIDYLHHHKWQLLKYTSDVHNPEYTIHRYIWALPRSEAIDSIAQ